MEAEVTAQSPDNVSDYFNDVVAPAGDFESESQFREFISNTENAKSYFDDVVKARGDFGSDQEFNSFLGLSGSSPAPVPSQTSKPQPPSNKPIKYVPDSKRKLQKEEIVGLVKTFLPGSELTNSAEIIGNKLAGKTEAEIVKMYPALGKQLATRMQNVQSGQKTSGSQSESSTSILPSLIDQAKRQEAFSDYEVYQKQFADADYDRQNVKQSSKEQQTNPFGGGGVGESLYMDATKGMYSSAKFSADQSRKKVDDIIGPKIRKDVKDSEDFLASYEVGFPVPNFSKISDYANEIVESSGLPTDGYLRQYVYNQVVSEATFKAMEPRIKKNFDPELKKIDDEIFEGFKGDDEEKLKLDAQVESVKAQIELELTNERTLIDDAVKQNIDQETLQYNSLTKNLLDQAELLKLEFQNSRIPKEVYEENVAEINEKLKGAFDAYNETQSGIFEGYLTTSNQIQSKYNTRLKRQVQELETSAQARVDAMAKEYEGKVSPERLKRLNAAYSKAVIMAQSEYERDVKTKFNQQTGSPLANPVANWINDKLKINFEAATVGLGGVIKAYGISFNIPSMQLVGDKLSVRYTLPQAKADEFGDLFDPRNFSLLSGQLIGVAAPTALISIGTAAATKNVGAVANVAAVGLAQFYSNAAMMSGMMWDETFKKSGSVAEANSKSSKMFDAQVKMIPIYFAGAIPYVGNLVSKTINKLPLAARVTMGAGVSVLQETVEELGENISEKNISANKEAFDDFFENVGDQWKQTAITVAPVAFGGGGGQINKTLSPEEKMIEAGRSYGAKARFSEITSLGKRDWVANTVLATSEGFTTTAINTMFSSGIIDQATRDEMIQLTDEAVQNISDAKGLGMNNGDAMVYNAIANNRNKINRQMLQAKEAGNESLVIALKEQLSTADATVREFASTRKGDFGVVTFSDGSNVILNDIRSQESLARIAELLKDKGVNGVRFYSKDGKDLMAQVEAMNAQPETTLEQQASVEMPTAEQQSKDAAEGNLVTFEYQSENEVPDVFKDKISSKGEINGKPSVKVTVAKSLADFYLQNKGEQATEQSLEQPQTPQQAPTQANPLADVESTAKALRDIQLTDSFTDFVRNELPSFNQDRSIVSNQDLSEAYHKAKADGSNPELVQAVEELLTPKQDADQSGKIEQSNIGERPRAAEQQQGQQANRDNQEGAVPQGENQTGGSDSTQQGGAQQESQSTSQQEALKEESKKVADAIRKLKAGRPGYLQSSIGSVVWDAAVEAVALAVEAGGSVAQAIADAVVKIKDTDYYKSLSEKKQEQFISNFDSSVRMSIDEGVDTDQGMATTGGAGAGGGTTGDGGTQSDGGNKTGKVRAMIQRVADRMRQKGIPEDQIQKVLEAGTYQPMSMAQMDKAAEALIEEYGLDAALDILRSDQSFNYEIIKALYNRKLGELKNIADTEGATIEQAVEIAKTISDMAAASTSEARSLGFNRFVYINNPDLFYKEKMKEDIESENNEKVKGKGRSNTIRTLAVKARKIRTDAISLLSEVMGGRITAELNGSERLAKRMEFLMKKLVRQNASEDGGASWKELVKALNLGGIFNALDNQKEVSEAIKNSLRKLNPTLQTPLDTAEIQELADSIVDIYSEIAEGKIKAMLENQLPKPRTFLGRERISRAAKAVIFGALDFGNTAEERATLSKFSVLFGGVDPNQFTDAQKAKLNQLAGNYVKAAPGFQKQIAMQRFNNALQQAIAYQKKWTTLTYHLGRGGFAFENYIYNNLLFAYGTFMKAFRGNIERILEKYITLGLLGETDVIRFNNRRKLPNVELDIDGQKVSVSVNLNEVLDAMYSAVRGLPKLAEAKSTGLNRAELELRDTKSLAGRRLKRFFTIPAGRTLMTLDAMTTTSSVITTKRQVLMQAIIDAYATYGVTKPRAEIQAIVDDILVPTDTAYENALAQAAQDVMNSQLYKDLGMTPADFPILDPRFSKEALGDKAKVYNEWLMRAREILDDQESQRASTSAVNDGWMPMSGTVESMMSQIDSYAAKVTNEMTYLGTPRGSMGVLATEISRISNSAPALKYIGITPMFVNATFNALNNMIRITPGLNVIQFAKYKATGSRGAYSTAGKREYDFESIVNVDKKNMIPTLVMTNLGLVAMLGVLSALRGDDEYEREKIIKGKGTFITPMKMPPWLSAIRNEKGEQVYRPGKIYYNGREVSDYKDGAYSFFFGAVATIDNNRLGFKNNPYADAPFKDEESGATDALYAYVTGVMATASEQSMMREQFKMVNDIMDMMYETPGGEYSAGDKLKKLVQRKGGSLVKMLVPYGRMLGDISQVMRDGDDEAMAKQARDFYEYAAQGTAYEEWVLKSNKTDWFGNPVKAEFFRVSSNPFPGFFDKDKGDASREIQMHLSHNYIPVLPPSTRIFVTITKDDLGGEEYLDAYYNSMKAMIDRGEESRVSVDRSFDKYEGGKKLYKGVVSTIELTAEEQSVYNEQRAKFVGAIVKRGSNMSAFEKMDNEGYRAAMDRLYTIGRNYAQLKAVPDLIEKDREDILKAFASQISKFQSDFGSMGVKMPGIGVEINEDFLKNFEK